MAEKIEKVDKQVWLGDISLQFKKFIGIDIHKA